MSTMIREIGDKMVQALDDLRTGKITPDQARAMAGVAQAAVGAANAEIRFIGTVKGLSRGGIFGAEGIQYLEPSTTKESERAMSVRLAAHAVRNDDETYKDGKGEFV